LLSRYYDGCAMILMNGKVLAQGSQFSLTDVETVVATVDIEEVRSYRFAPSRGHQAVQALAYERIETEFPLSDDTFYRDINLCPTPARQVRYHVPEEEIALGPACWMWDFLRRSKTSGYLVPLSGGIDSCATSVLVFSMCREVIKAIKQNNAQVIQDVQRITKQSPDWKPESAEDLCNRIFHTV
jgi:NAD+ synthase (glutamine-hydrolysing)